jgi:hypothetical protein
MAFCLREGHGDLPNGSGVLPHAQIVLEPQNMGWEGPTKFFQDPRVPGSPDPIPGDLATLIQDPS